MATKWTPSTDNGWLEALALRLFLDDHEGLGPAWADEAVRAIARGDLAEAEQLAAPHIDETHAEVASYDWTL